MLGASTAATTASVGTSQSREILRFTPGAIGWSDRQHDHVRLDAPAAQLGHRVLRRLGLLLPEGARYGTRVRCT